MSLRQKWIAIISGLALHTSLLLNGFEGRGRFKNTSGESLLKLKRIRKVNSDNSLTNSLMLL